LNEKPVASKTDTVEVWPHLLIIEIIATLLVCSALWAFSIWVEAPLEGMADPSYTPKVAKAPWYFVGLQELLVYFDPWIAGVALPGLIIAGLMAIPYIDRTATGVGAFAGRKRPLAWTFFIFGLFLWFGLIAIGQYNRGPHWAWYWPWESWNIVQPPAPPAVDIPWPAGLALVLSYLAAGFWLPTRFFPEFRKKLGAARYVATVALLLGMLAVPLKMLLRLAFDVHYVLSTPWFNI